MKILLIGYGKMGRLIEQKAKELGHEIVGIINSSNTDLLDERWTNKIDCAIEFTNPSAVQSNLEKCVNHNIPVVTGTTGWENKSHEIFQSFLDNQGALFYASNFSIGANIVFKINIELAKMMRNLNYKLEITEIHHLNKKDSPSGTAISLANDIILNSSKENWVNEPSQNENTIGIISKREENVPGTHIIFYQNKIDEITIQHKALNRDGFVLGAIAAAQFLKGKKGIFTMDDLI